MKFKIPQLPKIEGVWYLASPYSKYPEGIEAAFQHACIAASWLIRLKIPVFSPIAHTHPIAIYGQMDPLDLEIWMKADEEFVKAAGGIMVCKLPTWEESYGVTEEIKAFTAAGKPIRYMEVTEGGNAQVPERS